jgi:hypothetical protein
MTVIVVVEALAEQCNKFASDSRESREAVLKKWRTKNRMMPFSSCWIPLDPIAGRFCRSHRTAESGCKGTRAS